MPYTESYCRTDGSNLNAGSTDSATASLTYASGSWVSTTGVFTVASGNPESDGVVVGDFASVYADGSTITGFVGRVTAVSSTTITVSLTAKSGTAPASGTNTRTLKIGGAWAGPSGAVDFPFDFIQSTQTNAAGDGPRVNIKSGTYTITAAIVIATSQNDIVFQGFNTTPGDGSRPTIDANVAGASIVIANISATTCILKDIEFKGGGSSGSSTGLSLTGGGITLFGVVVWNCRGTGIVVGVAAGPKLIECESYGNNISNGTLAGISATVECSLIRCVIHDNSGSNTRGIRITGGNVFIKDCIIDTNGLFGIEFSVATNHSFISNCDIYNNGSDGIRYTATQSSILTVENSNFIKNAGWGIQGTGGNKIGFIVNCGFGAGTMANTSGNITGMQETLEIDTVNYATDAIPWVDADNGDFRITLTAAKDSGRGTFTQTQAGYDGAISYQDIGSGKHITPPSSGGPLINRNILIG